MNYDLSPQEYEASLTAAENRGHIKGAAEMGRRFKETIRQFREAIPFIIDCIPETPEGLKKLTEYIDKLAVKVAELMDKDITEDLKHQLACKKLSGQCELCLADGDTCHREAEGPECANRVDKALENAVKAGRVQG